MANLEHSAYGLYFTEHMRNVIENGLEYTNEHLMTILRTLTPDEFDYMKTPECVRTVKLVLQGMKIDEYEFEELFK